MTQNLATEIHSLLAARHNQSEPGCAVGVYAQGRPLAEVCIGVLSIGGEPITPTTNFRIASVTKQFTAACVLRLVDRGLLRIEDPVRRWLPELFPGADSVTVGHLIGHTSGLPDYEDLVKDESTPPPRDSEVLAIVARQEACYFLPGSSYRYSNTGYALLACLIERVDGRRFADYLREEIFLPCGMENSVAFEADRSTVSERAYGHRRDGDSWRAADQSHTSSVLGDGGIYTSIRDYSRWEAALQRGEVLSREAMEWAGTSGRLADGNPTHYGGGWRLEGKRGRLVMHHTGSTTGFNTFARRTPALGLCVVHLANRNGPEPKELAPLIEDLAISRLLGH
jgi:CubicO group peptidase (beta-lactamase class C family)